VQINQKELATIIMKLIQILKQTLGILSQKVNYSFKSFLWFEEKFLPEFCGWFFGDSKHYLQLKSLTLREDTD
jgi:hypothetical protein